MKRNDRMKWIATFDMEPLISAILIWCLVVSMLFICAGLLSVKVFNLSSGFGSNLLARSLPVLVAMDFKEIPHLESWPQLLIHFGFCLLLIMPYARLLTSFFYFLVIERDWKHAAFTGFIVVLLSLGLFSQVI